MGLTLVHIELIDNRTPSPTETVTFTILNTSFDEQIIIIINLFNNINSSNIT